MRTFTTISEAQAATEDIITGKKVGPVPHFNELLDWFVKHLPEDRTSIVHGDYKIDNMVCELMKKLTATGISSHRAKSHWITGLGIVNHRTSII